jgi:flagellar biosynthesis protein FlhA
VSAQTLAATGQTSAGKALRNSDVVLAGAVMLIIGMMVVPLPAGVLDLLLTLSLAASITILLIALYVKEPLEFSVFPSLLLLITLFRLALNISSARLILLNGFAGDVINAFGNFVVGGNYVVGIVVFLLLMIIQFAVITNGSGRVAEVAARFTLDAMPGKQMAIDADLNAGIISEVEARRRRKKIEAESDFYGAMDGASKFVKGDAIAGVAIIIVNIVGGFAIGMFQRGLPIMDALQQYTLMTVGDGLVAQIPALLVSTATGVIVTRAASEAGLSQDLGRQLLGNSRAIKIMGGLMLAFGLVPGLPKLPFFVLGGVAIAGGFMLDKRATERASASEETAEAAATPAKDQTEEAFSLLRVDPIALELGYGLLSLVDEGSGGSLLDRVSAIRRQIATELGVVLPKIRIRDNLRLTPNSYSVRLRGEEVAEGELIPNRVLAMPGVNTLQGTGLDGVETQEPVFGLPALWIDSGDKERAELVGYTVVDPASVLTTHLSEIIRTYAWELLSRQEVQKLLEHLTPDSAVVVQEVAGENLGLPLLQKILQNLLKERVSVRDLATILESVTSKCREIRDPDVLTEYARQALSRTICNQYREQDGVLYVTTLGPATEQKLAESIHPTDQGLMTHLSPELGRRFLEQVGEEIEKMAQQGHQPVLLCSARVRLPLRRFTQRSLPQVTVLSYSEASAVTEVYACGMVEVTEHD